MGSGDAWSILRADVQGQLRRAVDESGFQYLRCHGVLSDQLQVVRRDRQGQLKYNWRLVDSVHDALLDVGLRPFVELGFMPSALASGDETIFFYKANVTPPADPAVWHDLIVALAEHWLARYGVDEVRRWYFEVWNEPNLRGFWSGTWDDYLHLYAVTARALKRVEPGLRVGGPATTRGELIPEFLAWCRANNAPVDFVSTHVYPDDDDFALTDPNYRELFGRGEYLQTLVTRVADLPDLQPSTPIGGSPLEVHLTEWNTSWRWGRAIHDEVNQAAFICQAIHDIHERVASFAFWTLSDIFNEFPYPAEALVGGFGLLTTDGLPKPGYHAYRLLHRLGSVELPLATDADALRDELSVGRLDCWATRSPHDLRVLLSHYVPPALETARSQAVQLRLDGLAPGATVRLTEYRMDAEHASVLGAWEALGRPAYPTPAEVRALRTASELQPTKQLLRVSEAGELRIELSLQGGAVVLLELASHDGS